MTDLGTTQQPTAPNPRGVVRRSLLAATGSLPFVGLTSSRATAEPVATRERGAFASFEWLGTAGWRVRTATTTILVDPYLSRFDTGLASGRFDPGTPLTVDTEAIDAALGPAGGPQGVVDAILVSHTHWDHFGDVPHIAASRDAMVFTTLSGHHLAQAMGLPASQLAVVKGGEELHLGDTVVRVVRSLHSRTGTGGLLFPGVRTTATPVPRTIADLPEGDTLGFVIRSPDGGGVLLLGASDYDDQALRGLEVDTVALPVSGNTVTADYVGRLMRALRRPRQVVLVHWDDFERPLVNPPRSDERMGAAIRRVTDEIRRHSPHTKVLVPRYLERMMLL